LTSPLAALHAGRLPEAERLYRKALRSTPENADALHGLGIVLLALKRPQQALSFLDRALRVPHPNSQMFNNHATALNALGRPEEALASLHRAIELAPEDATLHYNLGNTLMELWRNEQALSAFARASALAPTMAVAWQNKAIVETRLLLHEAALASCDRHAALAAQSAKAHEARGEALMALGRPAEAIAAFEAAAQLSPNLAIAHMNRAHALDLTGRIEEAKQAIEQALREDPELAVAHCNAASMYLSTGEFTRGWQEYEWRWKMDYFRPHRRDLPAPLWLGREELAGRTILLHAEQGFGDTIQFCRYVPMVAALGARVVLEAERGVLPLLRSLAGPSQWMARGDPFPEFDFHCPLMSLPLAFGTQADSVPWSGPYLAAAPSRVAAWRERLGPARSRRVGLAWSGARGFAGDAFRSAPLQDWAALIRPGIEYICLQKDVRERDLAAAAALGVRLCHEDIVDFADVAALAELMDLVISVDSAPAHLAGALGRPVWVMLPFHAEWRWGRAGTATSWYPTAQLFRQATSLDWAELAQRAGDALERTMEKRT
jgi:tetratricopeptide (TPR) repeat protein